MKKKLMILLNTIMFHTLSFGNLNDPGYYQCWEEVSYANQDNEKQEFKGKLFEQFNKFVDCVKNRTGECNKGFILHGPAGNGKSTLATDFAKEVKAFALSINSSVEGPFNGTSNERLDRVFEHAKTLAQFNPVVIIIDELDTLLKSNTSDDPHLNYQGRTIGHFLKLVDSLPKDNSVTVIGTTNFLKSLDSRTRRNMRLEEIEIGNPNDADRKEILRHYLNLKNISISDGILNQMIKKTKGFCSADLQQLVNELSIKQRKMPLDEKIIKDELDRAIKKHNDYKSHVDEEAKRKKEQDRSSTSSWQQGLNNTGAIVAIGAGLVMIAANAPAAIDNIRSARTPKPNSPTVSTPVQQVATR